MRESNTLPLYGVGLPRAGQAIPLSAYLGCEDTQAQLLIYLT